MFEAVKDNPVSSKLKTQEERDRGCMQKSKIFPIAYEVRELYLNGKSFSQIAAMFPGINRNHVAGYINKNKIKRIENQKPKTIADIVHRIKPIIAESREKKANKLAADILRRKELAKKLIERRAQLRILEKKPEVMIIDKDYTDGKTILETNTGCWFPVGPKPIRAADQKFCAKPQVDKSLFCSVHKEIAIKSALSRAR